MTDTGGKLVKETPTASPPGAFKTTLSSLYDAIKNFTSMEKPYSVKADEQGVTTGEFIVSNASVASLMEKKRKALNKAMSLMKSKVCNPAEVSVTYFQNWSKSIEESDGLMLLAKPETAEQVCMLVKAAKKCNIKVSCIYIIMYKSKVLFICTLN